MTQPVRSPNALSHTQPLSTPEELIRILVRQALGPDREGCTGVQGNGSPAEEIILDIDVDGTRFLLVRLPKEQRLRIQLSPREQEIVRMVADGHSNKVIAGVLNISSFTVCSHLRRIFAKFGVASRAAMVARMLDHGAKISNVSRRPP